MLGMHVYVDENQCQGHTLCNMVAPELFKLRDEDGHSYLEDDLVPAHLEEAARKAALGCPEGAIRVVD
jgi:ferredoxin